jgi:hypothetical protein
MAPVFALQPTHVTTLLSSDGVTADRTVLGSDSTLGQGPFGLTEPASGLGGDRGPVLVTAVHPSAGPTSPADTSTLDGTNQEQFPPPSGADLIAAVTPFDRLPLSQAIARFFDQLGDLDVTDLVTPRPTNAVLLSLALLSTLTAVEVVRRRMQRRAGGDQWLRVREALGWEGHLGFPELPGSWSERVE